MRYLYLCLIGLLMSFSSFATPGAITGTLTLCNGTTTTLSDTTAGGTWMSSITSVATVSLSTGIVTGLTTGTAIITYTAGGSYTTAVVTVNPPAAPITGTETICVGGTTVLTDATPGGVWSTSISGVATISTTTGVVTGVAPGTTIITYTLTSTGCIRTVGVTVNSTPGTIAGVAPVCAGSSISLADIVGGGTWSSSSIAIATVSSAGVVSGIAPGTTTISYTPGACGTATAVVTVNAAPAAITGASTICIGSSISITLSDATTGGTWTSSVTGVAAVGATGIVTGIASGITTISYTLPTGCYATHVVTVNSTPDPIFGTLSVCAGGTTDLSDVAGGGTWSSSDATIASVTSAGVVTGAGAGTATISYSLGSSCGTVSTIVTVNATPAAITGATTLCSGGTATTMLTDVTTGGTWASSSSAVAIVGPSTGVVTGEAPGTVVISYYLPTGCAASHTITVNPAPAAISGAAAVCAGAAIALTDVTTGGTWASSATGVAGVDAATGIVTAVGAGTATISYSVGGACSATAIVTVNAAPAAITGTAAACVGSTTTLADVIPGGTWTSSDATIASIDAATGILTAAAAGTATISYTLATGCSATVAATISSSATITASATASACGDTYTTAVSGGVSYSWAPATGVACVACGSTTITPSGTTTYTVTGTDAGGCTNTATVTITADRIYGHITFSSTAPDSLNTEVWLVQFNPADSSIIAEDSLVTCNDAGAPYYEFDSKPAGNYLVKAKLVYAGAPGTSGYIPTYGASSAYWNTATTVAHATAVADAQDINMLYGTVPAGPGFISGLISSGAGKGTSGTIPAVNMLVYLKDATGAILTYTYTDITGAYAFSGLGNGTYYIYPEAYEYYTTASAMITLTSSADSATGVGFKQHTTSGTITPDVLPTVIHNVATAGINIFPNPAQDAVTINGLSQTGTYRILDMTGVSVQHGQLQQGSNTLSIGQYATGMYMLEITTTDGTRNIVRVEKQ